MTLAAELINAEQTEKRESLTEPESNSGSKENQLYRTILLFGAPGAGKGTVGKALGAIPGFVHVACGDVFRNLDITSTIGKSFVEYSARGLLVPDDTTIELWYEHIQSLVATHRFFPDKDLLVLDGIPRNAEQAKIMDRYIKVEHIFHLVCNDEQQMLQRLRKRALKENRLDDASDEVIQRRWRVYEQESQPVLDHYKPDVVQKIEAMVTPVEVLYQILGRLITKPKP